MILSSLKPRPGYESGEHMTGYMKNDSDVDKTTKGAYNGTVDYMV